MSQENLTKRDSGTEFRASFTRSKAKIVLGMLLNIKKNIDIIEKVIFDLSIKSDNSYEDILYQVVSDIDKKAYSLKKIYDMVNTNQTGLNHPTFNKSRDLILERNSFIEKPFEVAEGIFECKKCGSKKIFSYSKQTRGCDEGTSVFCECSNCNSKWVYSG